MFLSARQTSVLARVMATLAEPHGERAIRARVGELMLELLGAQYYASYVWDETRRCFDNGLQLNMDDANLARYEAHYQFHDPITLTLQQHRCAVRVSDVMPQPDLQRTEFFNDFLARDGLHWGVNLYAWAGDRNIGDMRIWRDRRRDNFGSDELQLLDLVRPALVAALQRAQSLLHEPAAAAPADHANPGLLSPREQQVARLAARGLADKDIALRLGISTSTVRTHLDHVYTKLDVRKRAMLAHRLGV